MKNVFLLFLILFLPISLHGQNLEDQFNKALVYKTTNDTDSAIVIFNAIIEELNIRQAADSDLALSAKLYLAEINAKAGQKLSATVEALHQLIEISTVHQEWEIVAKAHIILTLIYGKVSEKQDFDQYLNQLITLINEHQLETFYSSYAVRRATYFRQFTGYRDSVTYYAREAIDHANEQDDETRAEAYHLIGHMTLYKSQTEAIDYFRKAEVHYRNIGDYDGEVSMLLKIASAHHIMNQVDSALFYNNLAKSDFNKISLANLSRVYNNLARINRQMEKTDTAWHFLTLSYEAQIQKMVQENRTAITEAEERYQTEKKNQQIKQQEHTIEGEKSDKNRAILLSAILLSLILLLTYFYIQLRRANRTNRQQAERLKSLDEAKSRFFANVSHELRTPLTLMLGPVNTLLKEKQLSTKQVKLLQTASNSGQQLQQLINEILDLRKLELDKLEIKVQPTVLHSFFLQYITQFDSLAERKNIDFLYKIEMDETLIVQLDQEKCRQILHNLLSNAFKFTPNGGQIAVNSTLENQRLSITVSDTGRGIHPEDMPYILDRYFQTNRPEKPIEGGTGIGLALCKEYVELLGGKIKVESTLDKGSTFKLFFPVALAENKEPIDADVVAISTVALQNHSLEIPISSPQMNKKERPHILIVEDNPALSDYLKLILSEQYEITTAEHGQEALDYLFSESNGQSIKECQLILSDLMMPVMDGYQLLEKLKTNDATRHIPVMMLTARAELRDKLKALRIGVDDYLIKPFEEEELLVRVENLLRHQVNRNLRGSSDLKRNHSVPLISEEDQEWLYRFEQFVQKNISNSFLSVPLLADEFSMSEPTLFRQMKRITGLSPSHYFKEIRLDKALRLLENHTYNSIAKVAYEVGYTDPNSFTRAFKQRFGKPPSKFIL